MMASFVVVFCLTDHLCGKRIVAVAVLLTRTTVRGDSRWFSAKQLPVGRQIEPSACIIPTHDLAVRSPELRPAGPHVTGIPSLVRARIGRAIRRRQLARRTFCGDAVHLALFAAQLFFGTSLVVRFPAAAPHLRILQCHLARRCSMSSPDAGFRTYAGRQAL